MPEEKRPVCIGLYGAEDECEVCSWAQECQKMMESIESAVYRKGTHVRLTGKYSEKKYKPKKVP
jgi:disulfide oxidoreductase YuzD